MKNIATELKNRIRMNEQRIEREQARAETAKRKLRDICNDENIKYIVQWVDAYSKGLCEAVDQIDKLTEENKMLQHFLAEAEQAN